jgi:hypothetical protein
MRKATHVINSSKVAPQLIRMASLAIAVVAAEGDAGTVVGGDGASVEEVAATALVCEVALGYVDAVWSLVSGETQAGAKGEGERTRRPGCRCRCRRRRHVCPDPQEHVQ